MWRNWQPQHTLKLKIYKYHRIKHIESIMKRIAEPIQTEELCSYGCGKLARYRNGSHNLMCEERSTKCVAVKKRNSESGKKIYTSGKRISGNLCYKTLNQDVKDRMAWSRGKILNVNFSYCGKGNHKKYLINERGHSCESCKNDTWLGEPIPLELEHRDGDNKNNVKSNLLLLCPNCHAKTEFYRGRNINKGTTKVADEIILEKINLGLNIRQILLAVGLTPKGGNYARVKRLINGHIVQLAEIADLNPAK